MLLTNAGNTALRIARRQTQQVGPDGGYLPVPPSPRRVLGGQTVSPAVLFALPLLDSSLLLASARPAAKVLGRGDGWLAGRACEAGLQSESSGGETSKRTGEPGLVFRGPTAGQSFVPMLLVLRPRRSLLAIPLLHIEHESEGVAPETLPSGMTTAM